MNFEDIMESRPKMNRSFSLFRSTYIDHWVHFTHISLIHKDLIRHFTNNPCLPYGYFDIWHSIMSKIHWSWAVCAEVDKILRSPDVFIHMVFDDCHYECSILFKSDNNGMVNLIVDSYDAEERVKRIPHEYGDHWEFVV